MLSLIETQPRPHSLSKPKKITTPRRLKPKQLTADELCQLQIVTFRESYNHCRWPREVIERFLAVQA
jgi:hypothetical protein